MKYFAGVLLVLLWSGLAFAQMVSIKPHTAELRDSTDPYTYKVVLMLPRYYPLSVEAEEGPFLKVSDFLGRSGWIAKADATEAEVVVTEADGQKKVKSFKTVVVKSNSINIRSGPGTENKILLRADRGVAFRVLAEEGEWLQVLHENGGKGWLHGGLVWGG